MDMSSDIAGLQKACGSELATYQEIVRDEKSVNCRARWPLLAQTALGESVGLSMATEATPVNGQGKGGGGGASVRGAARFDGVVRPLAAAVAAVAAAPIAATGYSPAAVQAAAAAIAAAAAERPASLPLPLPLPRLVSVVERGTLKSPVRELPRAKAMTPPLRKPARAVAPAPRAAAVVASTAGTASAVASPRTGLSDLFKRLDAPQQRSGGPQR